MEYQDGKSGGEEPSLASTPRPTELSRYDTSTGERIVSALTAGGGKDDAATMGTASAVVEGTCSTDEMTTSASLSSRESSGLPPTAASAALTSAVSRASSNKPSALEKFVKRKKGGHDTEQSTISSGGSLAVTEIDVDEEIAKQERQRHERIGMNGQSHEDMLSYRTRGGEGVVVDVDSLAMSFSVENGNSDENPVSSPVQSRQSPKDSTTISKPELSEKTLLMRQEQEQQEARNFLLSPESSPEMDKLSEAMRLLESFGEATPPRRAQPEFKRAMTCETPPKDRIKRSSRRAQSCTEEMMIARNLSLQEEELSESEEEESVELDQKLETTPSHRHRRRMNPAPQSDSMRKSSSSSQAEEETKTEETEPMPQQRSEQAADSLSISSQTNSYAARVARKQRSMESPSSARTLDTSLATAATVSTPFEAASVRNRTSSTSQRNDGVGKRAYFGDVQAEIAEAQARALESRRNLKSSAAAAAATAPTPQPRPPLSRNWNSKHSVATEGSGVSSMDDFSVYSLATESGSGASNNNNNQTNQSPRPSHGSQHASAASTTNTSQQLSLSQHNSTLSARRLTRGNSSASLPGAYPTAGRAPFANPRFRGGPVTLFGQTITAGSNNNQNNSDAINHESITMADLSQSYYGLGLSNSGGRHHQRRRWNEATGESEDFNSRTFSAAESSYRNIQRHDNPNENDENGNIDGSTTHRNDNANTGEIVAVCVEEDDLEQNIRDEIIQSAAQADVVELAEMAELTNKKKELQQLKVVTGCLFFFVILAVVVGLGVGYLVKDTQIGPTDMAAPDEDDLVPSISPSASPTETPIPTLEKVYQDKVLRCGIYETTGFDAESGERFGVDVDWCRGIAAAILGKDSYEIVLINVTFANRFELIANRTIDVLTASSTYTMDRNVYEVGVGTGLTFSPPFMYDGLRFAGPHGPVKCMDDNMRNFGSDCRDIKVCVVGGTSYHAILSYRLPKRQIEVADGWLTLYGGLRDGLCNVIAAEGVSLGEPNVRAFGYTGNYTVGRSLYSKIPLSIVTRDDDPTFSDFCHSVLHSLFVAEEIGITQNTSHLVPDRFMSGSLLFGDRFENMFEDAISLIGNYGELYQRHAASTVIREGLTLLNNGSTGLLFAYPFGLVSNEGPGPESGGTLEEIMERGVLRCALVSGRPGFANAYVIETSPELGDTYNLTMAGLDVDYCRAIAAGLFSGSVDLVELVEVQSDAEGFKSLSEGRVDVFAGAHFTLQNDVREPTTGQGFTFSQPYYYGEGDDNLSVATRQDDPQWSAFCFWLVAATFYAEENGIDQRLSNSMPSVYLFGLQFLRMLRDPILEFGNYALFYERNLGPYNITRGGRNTINTIRNPGPQFYPVPGLLR